MATVIIREHVISKKNDFGIEVSKSLNQDFVFVNDKLAGYLTYADKMFKPLNGVGWDNSANQMVCEALQKIKGEKFGSISSLDAMDAPVTQSQDDDE